MTQDQRIFQTEFMDMVRSTAQENNTTVETELTRSFIEYIVDNGETLAPDLCYCVSTPETERLAGRYKLNAFDYSEENGMLDLFGTIYYDGQAPTLPKSTAQRMVNELTLFFKNSCEGKVAKSYYRQNEPDVADVMDLIQNQVQSGRLTQVRFFVISNGYAPEVLEIEDAELEVIGKKVSTEYHFWDMNEIQKIENIRQNNKEIKIDLRDEYQTSLECIQVQDEENNITSYLAIMPALTLAKIYDRHKVRHIDKNVRNFLGGKVKVNKVMANTLIEKPNLFFNFNNGISSTAKEVYTCTDEGKTYITGFRDWSIVNGGQTTSTIYTMYKKSKENLPLLQKAYVAIKVSEVKPSVENELPHLVPDIARFANSQTSIKESDLSANAPYMIEMQDQSRKCWTPSVVPTLWYFERLRGQFLTDKALEGGLTSKKAKKFEMLRPQSQRFNKTDIAKIEMAWLQKPFISCKGAEVCFDKYWDYLKTNGMPSVDEKYYQNLVAKMIIYNYIHRFLRESGNKGYAAILCSYSLALLSLRSQGRVDLGYIWSHQSLQPDLKDVLKEFCREISDYLTLIGTQGTKNPQTESKKVDFWNNIQNKTLSITIPESVLVTNEEEVVVTASQQADIDGSIEWGVENWRNLAKWTKKDGKSLLSIMEKKKVDHMVTTIERGEMPKVRLAVDCQRIKRLAEDNGFNVDYAY
jgi:hypothetical protein